MGQGRQTVEGKGMQVGDLLDGWYLVERMFDEAAGMVQVRGKMADQNGQVYSSRHYTSLPFTRKASHTSDR